MKTLKNQTVMVVGGSSGIGLAIAKSALSVGAKVIIASRNQTKLDRALQSLDRSDQAHAIPVDIMNLESIQSLFDQAGAIDHLVITASEVVFEPFDRMALSTAKQSFESKFWGPFNVVRAALPHLSQAGSITLFSGIAGQKPAKGAEVVSAINNAIDGFAKALAVSLSPIRVNSISPGLVDTPIYDEYDPEVMKSIFDEYAKQLLVKRYGVADEIASTAMYLMTNDYVTGTLQVVDGGRNVL